MTGTSFSQDGAEYPLTKSVRFVTSPTNVQVCKRRSGRFYCIGKTPTDIDVNFHSEKSQVKYYLKKIGYHQLSLIVTPSDNSINVVLKKLDLLFNPLMQPKGRLRKGQYEANAVLKSVLYDSETFDSIGANELHGKMEVVPIGDKLYFTLTVVVTDREVTKKISRANRRRNRAKREKLLVDTLLTEIVSDVLFHLKRSFSGSKYVDGIILTVLYPRKKYVLKEESTAANVTRPVITGFRVEGRRVVADVDIVSYQFPVGTTIVETEEVFRSAIIKTAFSQLPSQPSGEDALATIRGASKILINDNREQKFIEIK
jgi:hypothetical protein